MLLLIILQSFLNTLVAHCLTENCLSAVFSPLLAEISARCAPTKTPKESPADGEGDDEEEGGPGQFRRRMELTERTRAHLTAALGSGPMVPTLNATPGTCVSLLRPDSFAPLMRGLAELLEFKDIVKVRAEIKLSC